MAEGKNESEKGGGERPGPSASTRQYADAIARGLIAGRSVDDLVTEMVRQGWKEPDARTFVTTIDKARRSAQRAVDARPSLRRSLLMHLGLGVLWIVAGVTLMLTATPQRDLSSLGVAVIVFGIVEAVWALRGWKAMR